jgi:lipoprotein-anchoring transpeptidase ErfK/SrfK
VVDDPINLIDSTGLDWIYSQSTGQMTHPVDGGSPDGGATVVDTGYSGHGNGVNNSAMQREAGTGPIPQGTYTIQPQQDNVTANGTSLPGSMRITMPDGGSTLINLPDGGTRSGFLIHGDNPQGNRTASNGCIILQRSTRDQIGSSGDNTLRVVP